MSTSPSIRKISSFVSSREPRSSSVPPDTNKDEKAQTQAIDIQTLRAISPIVLAIKNALTLKMTREMTPSHVPLEIQAAQKTTGPNSGKDSNGEEVEDK